MNEQRLKAIEEKQDKIIQALLYLKNNQDENNKFLAGFQDQVDTIRDYHLVARKQKINWGIVAVIVILALFAGVAFGSFIAQLPEAYSASR